jgi:predicted nucleic acid-binding protein
MSLSPNDKAALDAQIQQFNDEFDSFVGMTSQRGEFANWDRLIAWRAAVALEEQSAALWSEDEESETPDWER